MDCTYEFYMIIGLDNANTFNKWRSYQKLIETVPFIVVSRKGIERDINVDWYTKEPHKFFKSVEIPDTSSTEVRDIIRSGTKKKEGRLLQILDPNVRKYINENHLYKE